MCQHVQNCIRDLAHNKKNLDSRILATRNQFAKMREELKRQEEVSLHCIIGEDRKYTRVIAEKLEWEIEVPVVGTKEKDLDGVVLLSGRLWASW